ncbi:hypothetical protein [Mesorhizobium sp. KR9-304]|uniref:hypothetical protein n=1 Tax=Mesorhizobium sp. KR9-304 TaxID=3156614 RepID=UPI0032B331DF
MYRSQAEHSADCERYPFEAIPRRVFLDTNVINLMVKYGDQIFEQAPLPEEPDCTRAHDVEALMHVCHLGGRAPWQIVAAAKTLDEIDGTQDRSVRKNLMDYAVEIVSRDSDDIDYAISLGRRMIDAPSTAVLPDASDREIIGNAIGLGCDFFCTCDRRTIVSKRDRLRHLPIRIATPAEWWSNVKPWAALWH